MEQTVGCCLPHYPALQDNQGGQYIWLPYSVIAPQNGDQTPCKCPGVSETLHFLSSDILAPILLSPSKHHRHTVIKKRHINPPPQEIIIWDQEPSCHTTVHHAAPCYVWSVSSNATAQGFCATKHHRPLFSMQFFNTTNSYECGGLWCLMVLHTSDVKE